ncbi:MAG TPA: DUF86 domain-containing protein [Bacillus bacterium]|nr:DUF86 domain-containing protein [Bacillus sp. (in: firmicutes)]
MYFVDRDKIEQLLQLIENNIKIVNEQTSWQSHLEKLALERVVHLVIESVLDVGNSLIDGFIMRDPGSYEDIIDILLDEKVIDANDELPLKTIISFRKEVVQNYTEIDHGQILQELKEHLEALKAFPDKVRRYLENELGVITAFKR